MIIDNYIKNKQIVSYDSKKTWIEYIDNKIVFCKKTTQEEYNNQINIKKILSNKTISINNKIYKIDCPSIYFIDDEIIYMEYFDGINLELILKNSKNHSIGVTYLNELINYFIKNKIYWLDFAPRNILISDDKIMLVDFEKGILSQTKTKIDYLRNHVYEEYALFLFMEERIFDENIIFISNKDINLLVDSIESPRYKNIAKLLGYNKNITYQKYLNILKLIIEIERPYIKDGKIIYPGVELDKLILNNLDNNPIELYSKEVLRLAKKRE